MDVTEPTDEPGDGDIAKDVDEAAERPSLVSPLLSGRSLQPLEKQTTRSRLRQRRGISIGVGFLLLVVLAVIGAKILAERTADSVTSKEVAELRVLLADATPRDFLAFNAGVRKKGSLAQQIRDYDGFVNVIAVAESSTIRFQPSGWWSGFTERCIVAVVTDDAVTVTVPKVACVRVNERGS